MPAPIVILANPYSGSGANRRLVDAVVEKLAARGLDAMPVWDPAERRRVLGDPMLDHDVRCLISAGGDGSMSDVVNDLYHAGNLDKATLAALPLGNENLVATELGFTRGVEALVDAVARGRTRRIDLAKAGDRLMLLCCSAGFDAEVVHRLDQWRRGADRLKRVSRVNYVPRTLGTLRDYRYPTITVEADGQTFSGAHVYAFNFALYGAKIPLAFDTRCDDGLIDYLVLKRPGRVAHALYLLAMLRRRHLGRGDVVHGRACSLRITGDVPLQLDGDPTPTRPPLEITAMPTALRVIDARPECREA